MPLFKLAVAQVPSIKGNINANIAVHLHAIEKASELGIAYIVFPELSLTGYEPELALALALAFSKSDHRLQPLIDLAIQNGMTIGVGAPLLTEGLPQIGLIVFSPAGTVDTYAKMHLHLGEERYFSQGEHHHHMSINGITIANAICADTNHPEHAKYCANIGAKVYIAGVMITERGYEADMAAMKNYTQEYNMLVAMANHNQVSGEYQPVGKSAIWSNAGLLAMANETQNALVIAEKLDNGWSGRVVDI